MIFGIQLADIPEVAVVVEESQTQPDLISGGPDLPAPKPL